MLTGSEWVFNGFGLWEMKYLEFLPAFAGKPATYFKIYYGVDWMK